MQPDSVLIISPVFNERAHLERTAAAVLAQRRRPDRWMIVDDGSSDGTLELARILEREIPFLTVIEAPDDVPSCSDNLAAAREVRAFDAALASAGAEDYDFIGKLDGDVELPPSWFEVLLDRFAERPRLGIAGGRLVEPAKDGWRQIPIPPTHVHGAVKLYRRECLAAIGGLQIRLGWDTIDETLARMRGYETQSFDELVASHHRPWGTTDGRLRGRARHGTCAWILQYPFWWAVLRSFKVGLAPPPGLSGVAFLFGYLRSAATGVPRVEEPGFRQFVRRELRERLRHPRDGSFELTGRKLEPRAAVVRGDPAQTEGSV